MSYCVNCGVELADSERRCPLCHTEVHNPRQPYDRKIPKPFPNRLDLFEPEDNRGFAAAITTLLLALARRHLSGLRRGVYPGGRLVHAGDGRHGHAVGVYCSAHFSSPA